MPEKTLSALTQDLINKLARLVRQELRLAQAEISEKATESQAGIIAIFAGLLLAFCALLILLQALVIALSNWVEPWLAAIIVGGVTALIAFMLFKHGQSRLEPSNLVPRRTLESVRADKDMVMEKVK